MLQLAVLAQQKAGQSCEVSPSTPSGSIPVYPKEPSKKRCRKPGAQPGHSGSHRPPPEKNHPAGKSSFGVSTAKRVAP
jgi:hypothetical protein